VLIDESRRGQRLVPLSETLAAPELGSDTTLAVSEALSRLSDTDRRLLVLVYVDGYTYAEIAAMTGATPGAIKTAVWRARQAFRDLYSAEAESD
jgi:RNA polymerase sigma factor (sigma-70 family)